MDSNSYTPFLFLGFALVFQSSAIFTRRLFLSLFFSFACTLFISFTFLVLGHSTLGLLSIAISCGLNYLSLVLTSLLIGSHQNPKPVRRFSISLIFFVSIAAICVYLLAILSWPSLKSNAIATMTANRFSPEAFTAFSPVLFIVSILALASLIATLLLLRRDDINDTK